MRGVARLYRCSGDRCDTVGLRRSARKHRPIRCQPDLVRQPQLLRPHRRIGTSRRGINPSVSTARSGARERCSGRHFRDRGPGVDPQRHGRCASTRQPQRAAASDPTCDGPKTVPRDAGRGARHVVAKQELSGPKQKLSNIFCKQAPRPVSQGRAVHCIFHIVKVAAAAKPLQPKKSRYGFLTK